MAKNQSHFQLRRDTNENWLKANPILKSGEPGFVLDTGALKIGNGKDTFSALAEIAGGGNQGQGGDTNPIYSFSLNLDGNYVYFNPEKVDEIKDALRANKIVIATMSDQDLFEQNQICAYEIKDGNTSFYCADGSSFTYNEEANRYNLNKS